MLTRVLCIMSTPCSKWEHFILHALFLFVLKKSEGQEYIKRMHIFIKKRECNITGGKHDWIARRILSEHCESEIF